MTKSTPTEPQAERMPYRIEHLGRELVDEYAWLQDKTDPKVISYLQAENGYAEAMLQHTRPLQEQLFQEMKARIKEDDASVPEPFGDYAYYWRMEAGRQYRVFCRRRNEPEAEEHVLLDENALAEGKSYCRVAVFEPSPDNTLLAYAVDTTGAWVFDLYIQDLRTGQLVDGPIPNTAWTVAWRRIAARCSTACLTTLTGRSSCSATRSAMTRSTMSWSTTKAMRPTICRSTAPVAAVSSSSHCGA